jgi:hypothetical protein
MKKLVFILFILLSIQASGQEAYKPLLVDGKTWTYSEGNFFAGYRTFNHIVDGDTLIDSKTWKKVDIESPVGSERRFEKAMREEGKKVYERLRIQEPGGGYREVLFADFDAVVGSQYVEDEGMYTEVTATTSIDLEGITRHQIILEQHEDGYPYSSYDDPTSYWTEGIGGDCGIYQAVQWLGTTGNRCTLLYCYEDGKCIYRHPEAVGIEHLPSTISTSSSHFFDLQGRQLQDKPEHGVYIRDGKKYVVR